MGQEQEVDVYKDSCNNEDHVLAPLKWVQLVSEHQASLSYRLLGRSKGARVHPLCSFRREMFILTMTVSSPLQGKLELH